MVVFLIYQPFYPSTVTILSNRELIISHLINDMVLKINIFLSFYARNSINELFVKLQ
jgi:hypothetical protein